MTGVEKIAEPVAAACNNAVMAGPGPVFSVSTCGSNWLCVAMPRRPR